MNISFKYRFEAAHRFTNTSSKCATPHGHSWQLNLSLNHEASAINLNKNFAIDFKDLKKDWKKFIDDELDHFFFLNSKDPLVSFLNDIESDLRIKKTPGDPTTEILASLFFKKAENIFKNNSLITIDNILLEETSTNSVRVFKKDVDHILNKLNTPSVNWWS